MSILHFWLIISSQESISPNILYLLHTMFRYYEGQMADFSEEDAEDIEEPEVKVTEAAEKV